MTCSKCSAPDLSLLDSQSVVVGAATQTGERTHRDTHFIEASDEARPQTASKFS